jgi:hypothetical protein
MNWMRDEVHREVIGALAAIQQGMGGVINPGDKMSFPNFIKQIAKTNSDKCDN